MNPTNKQPCVPSAPIVLAHGVCGLARLFAKQQHTKEYFPGVRGRLVEAGCDIRSARVSPTGSIEQRAHELKSFIRNEVGERPVHIIGHSMGGLDARYMISKLGMDEQALSLTTIGTPHRGTSFADWCIRAFSRVVCPLLRSFKIPHDAFFDLTTEACSEFNQLVPNVQNVRYFSVAGLCEKIWLGPEWLLSSMIVKTREGVNDGIVSVASATWGEQSWIWNGDHLNLVNWPNRHMRKAGVWSDRTEEYLKLLPYLQLAESKNPFTSSSLS